MANGDGRCHVGRQPILNKAQRIMGYQLMFRDTSDAGEARVENVIGATARVIVDTLSNIGTDTLLGEGVGFIGCDTSLAIGDLLKFTSYAKVRADSDTRSALRALIRTLTRSGVQVIGTRVETREQYEMLAGIDVGLYQGYFFAESEIVSGGKIDPERAEGLKLIVELEKDVEIEAIADGFKKSPSLSLNLLRLVNGLNVARAQKIDSVSQALMMMGARVFRVG